MDIRNSNAASRIKNLFISYHTLLCRRGIASLLEENEGVAVKQVLSAIQQTKFYERLESEIKFS